MAHEIDTSTGKAAMAYQGDVPWHGLGQQVDPSADLDTWIQEAGFDWEIQRSPAYFYAEEVEEHLPIEGRNVLYRSDNQYPLGIVSDRYKEVQPREVAEFFRGLTELGGFEMNTMGILRNGQRYWALASTKGKFNIGSKDPIEPYVLLATSADGSMSTVAHLTSIRVVCQNTLQLSVGTTGQKAAVQIPHMTHFDPQRVKAELGLFPEYWEEYKELSKSMAKRSVTREEAVRFFLDILAPRERPHEDLRDDDLTELLEEGWEPPERQSGDDGLVHIAKIRPQLLTYMDVYENATGQNRKATSGTAYGLANAVSRFWDHERNSRTTDTRLLFSWFQGGAREKREAFRKAAELVEAA